MASTSEKSDRPNREASPSLRSFSELQEKIESLGLEKARESFAPPDDEERCARLYQDVVASSRSAYTRDARTRLRQRRAETLSKSERARKWALPLICLALFTFLGWRGMSGQSLRSTQALAPYHILSAEDMSGPDSAAFIGRYVHSPIPSGALLTSGNTSAKPLTLTARQRLASGVVFPLGSEVAVSPRLADGDLSRAFVRSEESGTGTWVGEGVFLQSGEVVAVAVPDSTAAVLSGAGFVLLVPDRVGQGQPLAPN